MSRKYSLMELVLAFLLGTFAVSFVSNKVMADEKTFGNLEVFANIVSLVEQNYVDDVDSSKLLEGAINGMLRSLDPHSSYMTPDHYKEMQVETEGEFGGIGIEITVRDDLLTIVAPIEDTPASKVGLQAGDRIVKVDGESTFDMSLMDAVRKMRGKRGTKVIITIVREGFDQPKDFEIIRDVIHVASIKYELFEDGLGYARIRSFSKDTGYDLEKAISSMKEKGMKGLVLDLRNNPGGLLNQAVSVSELFLKRGELIVYTRGRIPAQNEDKIVSRSVPDNEYPMVVLVNKGSASASEIVAGALQDLKRAIIVGTQTFGKGSVQTIIPLQGQSGLRLTTSRYYTPLGRQIHDIGIEPDFIVNQRAPDVEDIKETGPSVKEKIKEKVNGNGNGKIETEGHDAGGPAEGKDQSGSNDEVKHVVDLERDYQLQRALGVLKSWELIDKIRMKEGNGG